MSFNPKTLVTPYYDQFGAFGAKRPDSPNPNEFLDGQPMYNKARGLIIPDFTIVSPEDTDKAAAQAVVFQFNPSEINYSKETEWGTEQRLGYSSEIDFWNQGGGHTISFRLFMDATAGTMYRNMRSNTKTQQNTNTTNGAYMNRADYLNSGMGYNSNGLLDEIAKLEAYQYPKSDTNQVVLFTNGIANTTNQKQFQQPPFLIFSYGSVVAKCLMKTLDRVDNLFNKTLNPVRAEMNITLKVIESQVVDTTLVLRPVQQRIQTTNDV